MKNTSFPRIWTKTSLKRIRRDLLNKKDSNQTMHFLCNASPEFKSIWKNEKYRSEIYKLAQDFSELDSPSYFPESFSALFFNDMVFQIRLDFLNHEIERLSKK